MSVKMPTWPLVEYRSGVASLSPSCAESSVP
jgi:hypothetical protein